MSPSSKVNPEKGRRKKRDVVILGGRFLQILDAFITLGSIGRSIGDNLKRGKPAPGAFVAVETIAAISVVWSSVQLLLKWSGREKEVQIPAAVVVPLDILFMGAYIVNVAFLGGDAMAPSIDFGKRSVYDPSYSLVKVGFAFSIINV
jgi:hypothetical protein